MGHERLHQTEQAVGERRIVSEVMRDGGMDLLKKGILVAAAQLHVVRYGEAAFEQMDQ